MKKLVLAALLAGSVFAARAADQIIVTVTNDLDLARPSEVIAIPFTTCSSSCRA